MKKPTIDLEKNGKTVMTQCETEYKLKILKFKQAQEMRTLLFAEWLDINGIRNNQHEWKWSGDNWTGRHTTKEMYAIFIDEYEKTIN